MLQKVADKICVADTASEAVLVSGAMLIGNPILKTL
jgi:hypothetical protein